ncbi:MAG TPA: CBS domain-containing protein [Halococcus sp.]|nr:CBS domain-containing protein [Halococcus sp.]
MSTQITVRDVMTREFLGVSEGDDVRETVSLLLEDGIGYAVVLRGRDPVGAMSERDALSVLVAGTDPDSATVSDVMSDGIVRIHSGASLASAAGAMSREGVKWLLAIEDDEPAGVVTAHDIVVASTMVPDSDETSMPSSGGTDPEAEYDTQGICEDCGALARDLVNQNGRLVCPNCRGE